MFPKIKFIKNCSFKVKKKKKQQPSIILLLHSYAFLPNSDPTVVNRVFMTHIGGRLHCVFLQNLPHSSLYLSELVRAFVGFHLLLPKDVSPHPV